MNNCPSCKKEVLARDYISCQNKECLEFNVGYLPYEWKELLRDLEELELIENDD